MMKKIHMVVQGFLEVFHSEAEFLDQNIGMLFWWKLMEEQIENKY